jgi:hypothetical protein
MLGQDGLDLPLKVYNGREVWFRGGGDAKRNAGDDQCHPLQIRGHSIFG